MFVSFVYYADSEFTEIFMLTFSSFMQVPGLLDALVARYSSLQSLNRPDLSPARRYNLAAPEDMSSWEEEAFEIEVAIPIRLRYE